MGSRGRAARPEAGRSASSSERCRCFGVYVNLARAHCTRSLMRVCVRAYVGVCVRACSLSRNACGRQRMLPVGLELLLGS